MRSSLSRAKLRGMTSTEQAAVPLGYRFYDAVFRTLHATRIDRLFAQATSSTGVILTVHRIRPYRADPFEPNRALEITPAFLEAVIGHLLGKGYDFVSMEQAIERVTFGSDTPFVALTFDDGYRDTRDIALPILRKYDVPATMFVTSGFADRSAPLWWLDLEAVIRQSPSILVDDGATRIALATDTPERKGAAFHALEREIRCRPWPKALRLLADLARQADIDSRHICDETCLDWDEVREIAKDPLITIGAHSVRHPILSVCDPAGVVVELAHSRARIEETIERPVRHFAYPNGDPQAAGPREFSIARSLGFASAVTTRPGLVYPWHKEWPTALPRISLNGFFQKLETLDVMLSGAPFLMRNFGSSLDVS